MTRGPRPTPVAELTRHFFRELFYLRFLTDAGADSVRRTIIAIIAGLFSLTIFFPQLIVARYVALSGRPTPEPYRIALLGGQLFTICLSMFISGLLAALVCQSVFPDETDYRILRTLPLTRRVIFGAKGLALLAFSSIFIAAAVVVFGIGFAVASGGRWAEHSLLIGVCAHATTIGVASACAVAAVLSIHGSIVLASPRSWSKSASVASQSAMIGVLILSLPLIVRTAGDAQFIQSRTWLLYLAPPAWFLGLEQMLQGSHDPYFARLAVCAGLGCVGSMVAIGSCYLVLYRRFEQVASRSFSAPLHRSGKRRRAETSRRDGRRHPVEAAVTAFTLTTLRRSGLHQIVFTSIVACGVALTVNRLLGAPSLSWIETSQLPSAGMIAVVAAPLVLMFFSVIGLRQTLMVPLELRANWVFRLALDDGLRRHQMDAVERALIGFCLAPSLALTLPLQLIALGPVRSIVEFQLNACAGLLLVEIVTRKWRRIPFTCTYIPARRPLVHTVLLAFTAYTLFVSVGSGLIIASLRNRSIWLILTGTLLAVIVALRRHRLAECERAGVEFEDSLPDDVQLMPLSPT